MPKNLSYAVQTSLSLCPCSHKQVWGWVSIRTAAQRLGNTFPFRAERQLLSCTKCSQRGGHKGKHVHRARRADPGIPACPALLCHLYIPRRFDTVLKTPVSCKQALFGAREGEFTSPFTAKKRGPLRHRFVYHTLMQRSNGFFVYKVERK